MYGETSSVELVCSVAFIAALIVFLLIPSSKLRSLHTEEHHDTLDTPLLHWTPNDPFTVRDLLNGGVSILGRVGSGKTSSSGRLLAEKIIGFRRSGGLILAAKPEDLAMWRKIFSSAGRSEDLRVFSPSENLRFNFLDYEMRHGGHTRNITQCIRIIGESLHATDSHGGGDQEIFWAQQQERMIFNAVEVIKRATGKVSGPDIQGFILGAATSSEQLTNDEWRKGFHCRCLEAGHNATKTPIETDDFQLAADYWLGEYPSMAEKTRSSILAGVMGLLHVFNTGLVRELVSGATNITPDEMFDGTWVVVDMSPTEWGELGSFVCAGWKFLTQRRVLRREAKPTDCINVIWADEAQQFVGSMVFDAQYAAQARSHLGCQVYLSQSVPGYYALKGESGKYLTQALLANFTHTFVHACDAETAEWAVKKLGKRRETFFGGSSGPATDAFEEVFGGSRVNGSFSEHYENVLQENVLMNGLRTGGKVNGLACDAIVIRSGESFSTGENFILKTFFQE